MALITVSQKRHRVYHRLFDHEEAQRLHAQGWSYGKLAERFGVTPTAVQRVCDPELRDKMDTRARDYSRQRREPCKGGCGRLVWAKSKGRSGYCIQCFAHRKVSKDVRETELRCTRCGKWKPDVDFRRDLHRKTRRGHHSSCRTCETTVRREYRRSHPEQAKRENRVLVEKRRRKATMASYIVLEPNGDGVYREVARLDAGSPSHAIEQAVTKAGDYVAVAEGRFKIMHVEPVQAFRVVDNR